MRFQLPQWGSAKNNGHSGPNLKHMQDKQWLASLPLEIKRRAYQKTITLRVYQNATVRVSCSKSCPISEIKGFLLVNKAWVDKSLAEAKQQQLKYPAKTFMPGELFLFLGKKIPLEHVPAQAHAPKMFFQDGRLVLSLPDAEHSAQMLVDYQKAMQSFYKQAGSELLSQLVNSEAQKMRLYPNQVSFRSQKTRWGSCSSRGNISLNWRLVCAPARVAKYVVVHELAHLRHQDHSAQFWGLVQEHMPEYKACKRWLNEHQREFDFLSV